ncbi:hypothetical protein L3Q82_021109 [Scortum barcoo]|uniref:Uncharacterized protein n=1 Tax=Scortum barcoo TaxID=214431 RepID=A0ACB8X342_9TELE|nr:hypothetical protein L3Q82_021109 [Scortum barcoo]
MDTVVPTQYSVLKGCASQLCGTFTHIFNLSLIQMVVLDLWKTSCLIPLPKKNHPCTHSDYRPVALTSHVMKSLERLVCLGTFAQSSDHHWTPCSLPTTSPRLEWKIPSSCCCTKSCSLTSPVLLTPLTCSTQQEATGHAGGCSTRDLDQQLPHRPASRTKQFPLG